MRTRMLLAVLLFISAGAFGADTGTQKRAIVRFYELRERTLDQRGTKEDVEKLVQLFSREAKYEHPVAGVVMSMSEAGAGLLAHLGEGTNASFHFENAQITANFAVVEVTLHYAVDGKQVNRRGVAIFEFKEGKIVRLAEY